MKLVLIPMFEAAGTGFSRASPGCLSQGLLEDISHPFSGLCLSSFWGIPGVCVSGELQNPWKLQAENLAVLGAAGAPCLADPITRGCLHVGLLSLVANPTGKQNKSLPLMISPR